MRAYVLLILLSCAVTFLSTPIALQSSKKLGAVTKIRDRDMHVEPTPRFGGVAIYAGVLAALLIASKIKFFAAIFQEKNPIVCLIIGATIVTLLGAWDDIYDLNWSIKLIGQFIAAFIVAVGGLGLSMLPFGYIAITDYWLGVILATFFMVLTMNAINFVDGLDGLAAGIAVIGGGAFFIASYLVTRTVSEYDYSNVATLIMAVLIGACAGFLPHNFKPAKIFMGDSGAMLIGLLMSAGSLAVAGQSDSGFYNRAQGLPAFMPIILPVAVICLPLLDLGMAVVRRTARGSSPFSADRGHIHHKLVDHGYSQVQAVILLYLWTGIIAFGTVAFAFFPWPAVLAVDSVVVLIALIFTFSPLLAKFFPFAQKIDMTGDDRSS